MDEQLKSSVIELARKSGFAKQSMDNNDLDKLGHRLIECSALAEKALLDYKNFRAALPVAGE